jgi:hypothetical protein
MENTRKNLTNQNRSDQSKTILAGIITGQIAGLIMAVVVMLVFVLFLGKSPLFPVQVIGSVIFGGKALQGFQLNALLAGLILHQAGPSLLWGLVFGFLAKKISLDTTKAALAAGLVLGAITMIDAYVLIPIIMNTLHGVDFWNREVPIFWDWAAHLVFGASFALFPLVQQKLNKQH